VELVGVYELHLGLDSDAIFNLDSQVFPSYVTREGAVTKQSALAKLKEKRALKQIQNAGAS
jgi:hypothetical protein